MSDVTEEELLTWFRSSVDKLATRYQAIVSSEASVPGAPARWRDYVLLHLSGKHITLRVQPSRPHEIEVAEAELKAAIEEIDRQEGAS